jgi:hypothetical protein
MKTKTILTYGAIAVGAYLAYTIFKKKTDANFANANGGLLSSTFSTSVSGSAGTAGAMSIPTKNYFLKNYSNYTKITFERCYNKLMDRYKNWRLYYTKPMDAQQMIAFFEECLKQRPLKTMTSNSNIGSPIGR